VISLAIEGHELPNRGSAERSDCGLHPSKMPSDLPNNFPPVRQETDVPRPFQQLQPGSGNRLSQKFLAGSRNDRVFGTGKHQSGNVDLPEPFRTIETLELGQTLSHHTTVSLPVSIHDELGQRSRLRLGSVQ